MAEIAHKAVAERYALASDATKKGKEHKADILGHFIAHDFSQKEAESKAHLQILAGLESLNFSIFSILKNMVTTPEDYLT